jgi:hypothetical protein
MDIQALKNLVKFGAAKYLTIDTTPKAYMIDEEWAKVALSLSKGIREIDISF